MPIQKKSGNLLKAPRDISFLLQLKDIMFLSLIFSLVAMSGWSPVKFT